MVEALIGSGFFRISYGGHHWVWACNLQILCQLSRWMFCSDCYWSAVCSLNLTLYNSHSNNDIVFVWNIILWRGYDFMQWLGGSSTWLLEKGIYLQSTNLFVVFAQLWFVSQPCPYLNISNTKRGLLFCGNFERGGVRQWSFCLALRFAHSSL